MSEHQHDPKGSHKKPILPRPVAVRLLRRALGPEAMTWPQIRARLACDRRAQALHEGGNDSIRGVFYRTLQEHTPGYKAFRGLAVFQKFTVNKKIYFANKEK